MTHTKEPWSLGAEDRHGDTPINADDWHSLALVVTRMEGHKNPCVDGISNARRIVACVNACAGIPTEQLESGEARLVRDDLADIDALQERVADLLSAITVARECIATDRGSLYETHRNPSTNTVDDAFGLDGLADYDVVLDLIDAAIAKAEAA